MNPVPAATHSESILPGWPGVGELLDQAVFVAGSWVYLHLYRLVGTVREELTTAMRNVITHLGVPHEVMRQVMDNSRTMSATSLPEAQKCADYVGARVKEVEIATRRAIIRTNPHDTTRRPRLSPFIEAGRALEESPVADGRTCAEPASELAREGAEISTIISALTADRVGPEPTGAQLERRIEDSMRRLINRLSPTYRERRNKEPRRRGDCIIWHEMLEFAISHRDVKVVVSVNRRRTPGSSSWVPNDLLTYTKDVATKVVWKRDPGWGDDVEPESLRPVSSFL